MLERLKELAAEEGITNIVTVLGTETDPKLPKGSFDWILLVDVYHEFQQPQPMLAKIRESPEAQRPGGPGRVPGRRGHAPPTSTPHHRMSVEQVLAEWVPAGFLLVETLEALPPSTFHLLRPPGRAGCLGLSTRRPGTPHVRVPCWPERPAVDRETEP